MMKLMACHLPSDTVQKKLTNLGTISLGINRKQTGLYGQISTFDKIDSTAFQKYQTTVKQNILLLLTHNLSSLIECTSFFQH